MILSSSNTSFVTDTAIRWTKEIERAGQQIVALRAACFNNTGSYILLDSEVTGVADHGYLSVIFNEKSLLPTGMRFLNKDKLFESAEKEEFHNEFRLFFSNQGNLYYSMMGANLLFDKTPDTTLNLSLERSAEGTFLLKTSSGNFNNEPVEQNKSVISTEISFENQRIFGVNYVESGNLAFTFRTSYTSLEFERDEDGNWDTQEGERFFPLALVDMSNHSIVPLYNAGNLTASSFDNGYGANGKTGYSFNGY